jgi:IS5 family transposase
LRQKDLGDRWVQKNGTSHYRYKNSICIDLTHGFIRRYEVTPTSIQDSQVLPHVLDPENGDDFIWVDSCHAREKFAELLGLAGFESCIHEKGTRNHPLNVEAKERNKMRSKFRARVEHVFAGLTACMGGKLTRRIGLTRTKAWWVFRKLTYNFLRYQHCIAVATSAA